MRAVLTFLALMISTPLLSAATIQSGEHIDFTRLVLPKGSKTWTILENNERNSIEVIIRDNAESYDISTVFDKIDRTRIERIINKPSGVEIFLACECGYSVFEHLEDYLVIDIGQNKTSRIVLDGNLSAQKVSENINRFRSINFSKGASMMRRNGLFDEAIVTNRNIDASQQGAFSQEMWIDESFSLAERALREKNKQKKQTQIEKILKAAVSEGNVKPTEVIEKAKEEQKNHHFINEERKIPSNKKDNAADKAQDRSIRLEYGNYKIGRDRCDVEPEIRGFPWGAGESFRISKGDLVDEKDKININKATELMKIHLSEGFGAEARDLMAKIGETDSSLEALSYIVDAEQDPKQYFKNLTNCNSAMSLWSLASTEISPTQEINHESALRTFDSLPKNIKESLASTIIKKLNQIDRSDLANKFLARSARDERQRSTNYHYLKLINESQDDSNVVLLSELIRLGRQNNKNSHLAVAKAIKVSYDSNVKLPEDIYRLNSVYLEEFNGHPEAEELWRAEIVSALVNKNFDYALMLWDDRDQVTKERNFEISQTLAKEIIERSPSAFFIDAALKGKIPEKTLSVDTIAIGIFDRLVNLGFYKAALELVDSKYLPDIQERNPLKFASLLLKSKQFSDTIKVLEDNSSVEALLMKRDVSLLNEDHSIARQIERKLEEKEEIDREKIFYKLIDKTFGGNRDEASQQDASAVLSGNEATAFSDILNSTQIQRDKIIELLNSFKMEQK